MTGWALGQDTWSKILVSVETSGRSNMERLRRYANVRIWTTVTSGTEYFAPHIVRGITEPKDIDSQDHSIWIQRYQNRYTAGRVPRDSNHTDGVRINVQMDARLDDIAQDIVQAIDTGQHSAATEGLGLDLGRNVVHRGASSTRT